MIAMVEKSKPAGPRDKAREWIAALLLGWVQSSGRAGLAAGAPLTAAQADEDGTLRGCGAEDDWSIDYTAGNDEAVITWANRKRNAFRSRVTTCDCSPRFAVNR